MPPDPGFVARFGHVFEHSPWVVERAAALDPAPTAAAIKAAFAAVLAEASRAEILALLRAHPRLADKVAIATGLTADSAAEQASAGLDRLTADEHAAFMDLNAAYEARFSFPFIICVRLHTKAAILAAMRARLGRSDAAEFAEALAQVTLIAGLRLDAALAEAAP